jgi:hypothetical protein
MKKLKKLFFAASTLAAIGLFSLNAPNFAGAQITIKCPTGDTMTCYTVEGGLSVKKGEGKTEIIIG